MFKLLVLIFLIPYSYGSTTSSISHKICSLPLKESKSEKEMVKQNDKILLDFALDPIIKTEAEAMLTVLITGKSPMITSWIKTRGLDPVKNPDKIALEWDKYYAKNFILNKYPNGKKEIDSKVEATFNSYIKKNLDDKTKKKFEAFILNAKKEAITTIQDFPISDENKNIISTQINQIKLYWPKDLISSKYVKAPLEFIDWTLAYDPSTNEINVGLNSLIYNDQTLKSVLRHEIAHSFDSCRWGQNNKTPWPFEKIGSCLRSMAQTRNDSQLESIHKNGKMSEDDFQKLKNNLTCNTSAYPPMGLQADQLPETFADWFSAEATPLSEIDGNFRSDLCNDTKLNPGSSYLSNNDRLYKIFLANRKIKNKLNDKSMTEACHY